MSTNLKQKFVLVSCFDDFPFSFVVVVVVLHFSLGDRVKTKHHILSQSEVKSIPIVTCALSLGYGPIYTIRFCRMRQAHDRPTT